MEGAAQLGAFERERCAELALVPGRPFDIALRFAPSAEAERQLALEALFASLRELPGSISEPGPGLAQLSWWSDELARAGTRGSQHPVVRALLTTGAINALDGAPWRNYLAALGHDMTDPTPDDTEALWRRLQASAGPELLMLAGISTQHPCAAGLVDVAAAGRLLHLLARLQGVGQRPRWLPAGLGRSWPDDRSAAAAGLANRALQATWPATDEPTEGLQVPRLRWAIERRCLQRLAQSPVRALARDAARSRATDVVAAWWLARNTRSG